MLLVIILVVVLNSSILILMLVLLLLLLGFLMLLKWKLVIRLTAEQLRHGHWGLLQKQVVDLHQKGHQVVGLLVLGARLLLLVVVVPVEQVVEHDSVTLVDVVAHLDDLVDDWLVQEDDRCQAWEVGRNDELETKELRLSALRHLDVKLASNLEHILAVATINLHGDNLAATRTIFCQEVFQICFEHLMHIAIFGLVMSKLHHVVKVLSRHFFL